MMKNRQGTSPNVVRITPTSNDHNPMKDYEVIFPPDDTISCMEFSPPSITNNNFLIAGSWDNHVRCWEIGKAGYESIPKQLQSMTAPVLDVAWSDVGQIPLCFVFFMKSLICFYMFHL